MSFDEACYKDMVKKDPFAAFLFIVFRTPENQRESFRKWWMEAMGLKKEKAGTSPAKGG